MDIYLRSLALLIPFFIYHLVFSSLLSLFQLLIFSPSQGPSGTEGQGGVAMGEVNLLRMGEAVLAVYIYIYMSERLRVCVCMCI